MEEQITDQQKLEAANAIMNLIFTKTNSYQDDSEEKDDAQTVEEALLECYNEKDELLNELLELKKRQAEVEVPPAQEVIPVTATINSIIARNLKALDVEETILSPDELIQLAHLSSMVNVSG